MKKETMKDEVNPVQIVDGEEWVRIKIPDLHLGECKLGPEVVRCLCRKENDFPENVDKVDYPVTIWVSQPYKTIAKHENVEDKAIISDTICQMMALETKEIALFALCDIWEARANWYLFAKHADAVLMELGEEFFGHEPVENEDYAVFNSPCWEYYEERAKQMMKAGC